MTENHASSYGSLCCGCASWISGECPALRVTRRQFLSEAAAVTAGGLALSESPLLDAVSAKEPVHQLPVTKPLKVQPVLAYALYERRPSTSWRWWGGILSEQDATEEKERIHGELTQMAASAGFPLEILPVAVVQNPDQAQAVAKCDHDAAIVYPASGLDGWEGKTLKAFTGSGKWTLMFLRHRSGPVYFWYGFTDLALLRTVQDVGTHPVIGIEDIVVDDTPELQWRLRALFGLKNIMGKRIVAVGGPGGIGPEGSQSPDRARETWKLDIVTVPYPELAESINRARRNDALVKRASDEAEKYLRQKGLTFDTSKDFIKKSFLLYDLFKTMMDEARTDSITVNECLSTIMPIAETSACLPLSMLSDEGYTGFCESDFAVIPSGLLLHYISGKPVFLNDPTYPHQGVITLAHCTAPRKMDGEHLESARILTHYESDYGAAPKVEMKKGQAATVLDPDFAGRRWMGFEAEILDNPAFNMCRTQVEVRVKGDWKRVVPETRGYHWMLSYGQYLREVGYALKKVGVDWLNLS